MEQQLSNLTAAIMNSDLNLHKPSTPDKGLKLSEYSIAVRTCFDYCRDRITQADELEILK